MIALKLIALALIVATSVFMLVQNTNKWAQSLRRYYIKKARETHGDSSNWEQPWRFNLFKTIVIFFGLMFIIGAYVLIFSIGYEVS